jgi:hypothetical protein
MAYWVPGSPEQLHQADNANRYGFVTRSLSGPQSQPQPQQPPPLGGLPLSRASQGVAVRPPMYGTPPVRQQYQRPVPFPTAPHGKPVAVRPPMYGTPPAPQSPSLGMPGSRLGGLSPNGVYNHQSPAGQYYNNFARTMAPQGRLPLAGAGLSFVPQS